MKGRIFSLGVKVQELLRSKEKGMNELVVVLFLIVISIVAVGLFKTGALDIIQTVIDKVKAAINTMMA